MPSGSLVATNPIRTQWAQGWGVEEDVTTRLGRGPSFLHWSRQGGQRSHNEKKTHQIDEKLDLHARAISNGIDADFTLGCATYWVSLWKAFHYCLGRAKNLQAFVWTLPQTRTRLLIQQPVWWIREFATERNSGSGTGVALLAGYWMFPR